MIPWVTAGNLDLGGKEQFSSSNGFILHFWTIIIKNYVAPIFSYITSIVHLLQEDYKVQNHKANRQPPTSH